MNSIYSLNIASSYYLVLCTHSSCIQLLSTFRISHSLSSYPFTSSHSTHLFLILLFPNCEPTSFLLFLSYCPLNRLLCIHHFVLVFLLTLFYCTPFILFISFSLLLLQSLIIFSPQSSHFFIMHLLSKTTILRAL